jgi:hypothetical protein
LQHSALDARIIIDQVANLRIAGPNPNPSPRSAIDTYVDVPVNTDLRWQVSFNLYASGQEGTTDVGVALTKQEITLELPNLPGNFTGVQPPVKPLTGGTIGTTTPGVVVIPGGSPSGTTITRPATGSSVAPPQSGGTALTPSLQRPPVAPGTGSTSSARPPGALIIPRGVESEQGKPERQAE